jgi:hypothetical protein
LDDVTDTGGMNKLFRKVDDGGTKVGAGKVGSGLDDIAKPHMEKVGHGEISSVDRKYILDQEIKTPTHAAQLKHDLYITSEYKKLEGSTLKSFEGGSHKGHAYADHVGHSIDDLQARMKEKPFLKTASSFKDQATAEMVYKEMIKAKKDDIIKWIGDEASSAKIEIKMRFEEILGHGLKRDQVGQLLHSKESILHLRKTDEGVKILSLYLDI